LHFPGFTICAIYATTLLRASEPFHVVAARLGHADPSITLGVYAHVIRESVSSYEIVRKL
jgi:integrase